MPILSANAYPPDLSLVIFLLFMSLPVPGLVFYLVVHHQWLTFVVSLHVSACVYPPVLYPLISHYCCHLPLFTTNAASTCLCLLLYYTCCHLFRLFFCHHFLLPASANVKGLLLLISTLSTVAIILISYCVTAKCTTSLSYLYHHFINL